MANPFKVVFLALLAFLLVFKGFFNMANSSIGHLEGGQEGQDGQVFFLRRVWPPWTCRRVFPQRRGGGGPWLTFVETGPEHPTVCPPWALSEDRL